MKKKICSSAMAALLCASSIAFAGGPEIIPIEDYFSGFYVGGTGSVHHVDFDSTTTVSLQDLDDPAPLAAFITPGNLFVNDTDGASVDGYGGIQGGFGWTFNHVWYLGVQGWGEWGTQKSTSTAYSKPVNVNLFNTLFVNATGQLSTETSISNDYGVAAKLGYVVAPRTLVYGKVGASWADVGVSDTATGTAHASIQVGGIEIASANALLTGSSNTKQNKVGLLLGIGAEQFIYEDFVSLNIEYDYVNYGTVSTGPVNLFASATGQILGQPFDSGDPAQTALTTRANTNAAVNSFLAGLNFYFGRNWF